MMSVTSPLIDTRRTLFNSVEPHSSTASLPRAPRETLDSRPTQLELEDETRLTEEDNCSSRPGVDAAAGILALRGSHVDLITKMEQGRETRGNEALVEDDERQEVTAVSTPIGRRRYTSTAP
jgi:hypothetical protein